MYRLKIAGTDQVSVGPVTILMVVKMIWSTWSFISSVPYLPLSPISMQLIYYLCRFSDSRSSSESTPSVRSSVGLSAHSKSRNVGPDLDPNNLTL